jgi:hypothetical protein
VHFQVRRSYLWLGIFSTAAFAAIGGVSVFVAAWNIDRSFRYPLASAYGFGLRLRLFLGRVAAVCLVSHGVCPPFSVDGD